jgi:hypothetical protein
MFTHKNTSTNTTATTTTITIIITTMTTNTTPIQHALSHKAGMAEYYQKFSSSNVNSFPRALPRLLLDFALWSVPAAAGDALGHYLERIVVVQVLRSPK